MKDEMRNLILGFILIAILVLVAAADRMADSMFIIQQNISVMRAIAQDVTNEANNSPTPNQKSVE